MLWNFDQLVNHRRLRLKAGLKIFEIIGTWSIWPVFSQPKVVSHQSNTQTHFFPNFFTYRAEETVLYIMSILNSDIERLKGFPPSSVLPCIKETSSHKLSQNFAWIDSHNCGLHCAGLEQYEIRRGGFGRIFLYSRDLYIPCQPQN